MDSFLITFPLWLENRGQNCGGAWRFCRQQKERAGWGKSRHGFLQSSSLPPGPSLRFFLVVVDTRALDQQEPSDCGVHPPHLVEPIVASHSKRGCFQVAKALGVSSSGLLQTSPRHRSSSALVVLHRPLPRHSSSRSPGPQSGWGRSSRARSPGQLGQRD